MSYREELITTIKNKYAETVKRKRKLEDAEKTIIDYFNVIKNNLTTEIEASNGDIKLDINIYENEILRFTLCLKQENEIEEVYISFKRVNQSIDVIMSDYTSNPYDQLYIDDTMTCTNKAGNKLDDTLLDIYLRKAFYIFIH